MDITKTRTVFGLTLRLHVPSQFKLGTNGFLYYFTYSLIVGLSQKTLSVLNINLGFTSHVVAPLLL